MTDTKDNARNELLYVSTTAPSTESAARLPASYTKLGLVSGDTLALSKNMIDANDKDTGIWTEQIPGRNSGTISVQGNRPKDGNAGQTVVRNAFITDPSPLVYWLRTDNTVGDLAVHGKGYVESYEEGGDDETVRSFSTSLSVDGQPTFFVIQT